MEEAPASVNHEGTEGGPVAPAKDPLVRFLGGCALVVGGLAALVVVGAALVSWRLTRDEAPGHPPETFVVGDEARYWCLDLSPNDAGLKALLDRWAEIDDDARRALVRGSFLENIPLPTRRARLADLAPLTVEFSLFMSDPAKGLQVREGWAARGTFSRGMLRMRAGLKLMRWIMTRDAQATDTFDVDGITVTRTRDQDVEFAIATVGNRVIVANDENRMRAILRPSGEGTRDDRPDLQSLHDLVKQDGEDAWAFLSHVRLAGLSGPVPLHLAAASFDVNDRDELVFRMAVADSAAPEEASAFRGTAADCAAVASSFLPGVPADAITIDGSGAHPLDDGSLGFTGRIPGLSHRLAQLVGRATGMKGWGWVHRRPEPETPSATPTPPSPATSSDPRSGTRAAPTREGNPTPRR